MNLRANALSLLTLLVLAPSVGAATLVSGYANVLAGGGRATAQDSASGETSTSVVAQTSYTFQPEGYHVSGSATGSGLVDYGVAKVGVSGSVVGSGADAYMAASFADNFLILGGSQYAGQAGTLTIDIAFDYRGSGFISGRGGTVLDLQQQLRVGSAAGSVEVEQRLLAQDTHSGAEYRIVVVRTPTLAEQQNLPFSTAYTVTVPFLFDQLVSIYNFISVFGGAGAADVSDIATFELNALNSYYWAGMTVRDATGAVVTAGLVSDSGTDWRRSFLPTTAVPEPATTAMVAFGLFLLSVAARRRS